MNVAFARGQRDALNELPADPKSPVGTFKHTDYFEGYFSGQATLRAMKRSMTAGPVPGTVKLTIAR